MNVRDKWSAFAFEMAEQAGESDHGGVVGAECTIGNGEAELVFLAGVFECVADSAIHGDAAGDGDEVVAEAFGGFERFANEDFSNGLLEGCGDVGDGVGCFELLKGVEDGGFHAGEGEIVMGILEHGAGEVEGGGITSAGGFFDFGSAGVGQPEHFADFIKGLAGGIITGGTDFLIASSAIDIDQEGVPAGDDEAEVARNDGALDEGREEVAFEVVDAQVGDACGKGNALGGGAADEQ